MTCTQHVFRGIVVVVVVVVVVDKESYLVLFE